MTDAQGPDGLARELTGIVGAAHLLRDKASCALAGSDLFRWPGAALPDMVLQPAGTAETAACLAALHRAGRPIVPRGAGLSYTAGVVPQQPAAVLDLRRLDAVRIEAGDLTAVVGAGCTWQRLAEALMSHGLRPALAAPISGTHSTVGGAASQGLPGGLDGVVGLTVALADGTVVRTGSGAIRGGLPFWRYHGPDLTGLFLGDCGAFGVKTEIVLRLVPERPCAFASFAFDTGADVLAALTELQCRGLVSRAFAVDRTRVEAAGRVGLGEALRIAAAAAARAGSPLRALRDLAALHHLRGAAEVPWSLHLTAEGVDGAAAEAQLRHARRVCRARGREIPPAIPKAMRARPFSVRGMVGPDGERWVPVHGILALSRAEACFAALEAHLADRAPRLGDAGLRLSWLISSAGAYVSIEPMFLWRDALDPIHLAHLSPRNRDRFGGVPDDLPARELVRALRTELRDIFDRHGATHAQLGRFYRGAEALEPDARALLEGIKRAVDPAGRMNPGVLGLSG